MYHAHTTAYRAQNESSRVFKDEQRLQHVPSHIAPAIFFVSHRIFFDLPSLTLTPSYVISMRPYSHRLHTNTRYAHTTTYYRAHAKSYRAHTNTHHVHTNTHHVHTYKNSKRPQHAPSRTRNRTLLRLDHPVHFPTYPFSRSYFPTPVALIASFNAPSPVIRI